MASFQARLTGYWPFQKGLSAADRLMEGGPRDRMGRPLYTLESYQRGDAPYVSVSGDDAIFPYGQRIELDAWPGVEFRVVDTGSHFRGEGKVYREEGREPLDICVETSASAVPKHAEALVYEGDVIAVNSPRTVDRVVYELMRGQFASDESDGSEPPVGPAILLGLVALLTYFAWQS